MNSIRLALLRAKVPLIQKQPLRCIASTRINNAKKGYDPDPHEPYHDEGFPPFTFKGDHYIRRMVKFWLFLASGFWYPFWIYDYHRKRRLTQ